MIGLWTFRAAVLDNIYGTDQKQQRYTPSLDCLDMAGLSMVPKWWGRSEDKDAGIPRKRQSILKVKSYAQMERKRKKKSWISRKHTEVLRFRHVDR
jgi:hypothetical protein